MKFCYVDESGAGEEPVLVHVGILTDTYRMGKTKIEWEAHLRNLATTLGRDFDELKAHRFYRGKGMWSDSTQVERDQFVDLAIEWLVSRKHYIVLAAINKERYRSVDWSAIEPISRDHVKTEWGFAALHALLQVQRSQKGAKGQTLFIFDEALTQKKRFLTAAIDPPDWTDGYYKRTGNAQKLQAVVDIPLFADSQSIGLLQLADLFAYLFRRYTELLDENLPEHFSGEATKLQSQVQQLSGRLLDRAHRWPAYPKEPSAVFYNQLAPDSLRVLPA